MANEAKSPTGPELTIPTPPPPKPPPIRFPQCLLLFYIGVSIIGLLLILSLLKSFGANGAEFGTATKPAVTAMVVLQLVTLIFSCGVNILAVIFGWGVRPPPFSPVFVGRLRCL